MKEAMKLALEALEMYCEHGAILRPLEAIDALKEALAKQEHDCTRSHPHEEMSKDCELRTEIARLTNKLANIKQEQGEPVAWWIPKAEQFCLQNPSGERPFAKAWEPLYTTPQQRKPLWIDPTDKTQAKFLPNIGEPVIFCCRGETYFGAHTGGGFQDALNNENYFNTWACRWMPIHSSKPPTA